MPCSHAERNPVTQKLATQKAEIVEADFPIQTFYRVHILFLIPEKWRLGKDPCELIVDSARIRRNPVDVRVRIGEYPDVPNLLIIEGKNVADVDTERVLIVNIIRSFAGYKFFKTGP